MKANRSHANDKLFGPSRKALTSIGRTRANNLRWGASPNPLKLPISCHDCSNSNIHTSNLYDVINAVPNYLLALSDASY